MHILVTNDDGFEAPGLIALANHLDRLGQVVRVAPATEQSARSHALTMNEPLRVHGQGPGRFAVNGTPADCVYIGLHHLCDRRPDVVVSGINRGTNLGGDVHYSGTVAAAREAALAGVPALAVSLDTPSGRRDRDRNWDSAALLAVHVVQMMLANKLPAGALLNLNVPDVPADQLSRLHVTRLGRREYAPRVQVNRDPRGREYYWIGGDHVGFCDEEGTDGYWFSRGHPTLSPLSTDSTALDLVDAVGRWKARPTS